MMAALKVMTYFKVSLSTHNWDRAIKKPPAQVVFCCLPLLGPPYKRVSSRLPME